MEKEILDWCINLLDITMEQTTTPETSESLTEEVIGMLKYYRDK